MTCKDCIHSDLCKEMDRFGVVDLPYEDDGAICTFFKGKADLVEVVRCKDCKWSEDFGLGVLYCRHPDVRNALHCRTWDYCNDGERKDGADNGQKP